MFKLVITASIMLLMAGASTAEVTEVVNDSSGYKYDWTKSIADNKQGLQALTDFGVKKFPQYEKGIRHISSIPLGLTCQPDNDECNKVLSLYLVTAGSAIHNYIGSQMHLDSLKTSSKKPAVLSLPSK